MKCRKCNEKLKNISRVFDSMGFIDVVPKEMYCENNKCEMFGIVVVAGIPDENDNAK